MDSNEIIVAKLENLYEKISALKDELAILENESYELELKLWLKNRIKCDRCAELDCYQRKNGGKIDCKMFSPKGKY